MGASCFSCWPIVCTVRHGNQYVVNQHRGPCIASSDPSTSEGIIWPVSYSRTPVPTNKRPVRTRLTGFLGFFRQPSNGSCRPRVSNPDPEDPNIAGCYRHNTAPSPTELVLGIRSSIGPRMYGSNPTHFYCKTFRPAPTFSSNRRLSLINEFS